MAAILRKVLRAGGISTIVGVAALPAIAQEPARPASAPTRVVVGMPDLVVDRVEFQFVKQMNGTHERRCDLFNVVPTIANRGKGAAGTFKVLLERNQGAGGAFVQPCPLCYWEVRGLAAGAAKPLEVRQFNNCGLPSTFRITADSDAAVRESDESNNRSQATYKPTGAR